MLVASKLTDYSELHQAVDIINDSGYYAPVTVFDLERVSMYGMKSAGIIIACAMVIYMGDRGYLDYLCVKPQLQGQGYAVRLLDFIAQDMATLGVRRIHACVNGTNEVASKLALRYHAKVGFPYLNILVNLEENHG